MEIEYDPVAMDGHLLCCLTIGSWSHQDVQGLLAICKDVGVIIM
jgi:hypothetical protein